jgi:hypothetical protein
MPDNTPSAASHWAAAIGQRLNTGHYGPALMTDHDSQLFVQLSSGPQARALATSVAGSSAIGERWEDADTNRTFLLALVGVPIVVTWTEPLPVLPRGGRSTTLASPRWKEGMTL